MITGPSTGASVDVIPEQVGVIDPGSEMDVEISGAPTETGIHSFELRAIPDTGEQASLSITAGIASVKDYLQSALQDVQRLQSALLNRQRAWGWGRYSDGGGSDPVDPVRGHQRRDEEIAGQSYIVPGEVDCSSGHKPQ